ncbi:unnamed protein product [Closterium sp. NIES-54]
MQQTWTGPTVVGVPIREEEWEVACLRVRLTQLQAPVPWLPLLDHPQIASHLLAMTKSARPIYLTRMMPPRPGVVEAFRDLDTCLEECFEQLFPSGILSGGSRGWLACSCTFLPEWEALAFVQ